VLVASDALGVLHSVDATLTVLRVFAPETMARLRVVLSAPAEPDASTGTNAAELERLGIASPVVALERGATDVGPLIDWLLS
jgi:dethiobiotin synthetase